MVESEFNDQRLPAEEGVASASHIALWHALQ
jgi:hypothetical protein